MAVLDQQMRGIWIAAGTLLIVAFLSFAILDDWMKRQRDRVLQLQKVNDWQLARKRRRWHELPVPEVAIPPRHAAVAKDLDLFGQASLFQLVCLAHTPRGRTILRDWILEAATPEEIASRQQAVRELAPEVELREELLVRGHLLQRSLAGPEAFVTWAEGRPLLERLPWVKWCARFLTLFALLAFAALVSGLVAAEVGATLVVVALILNVLLSVILTGSVHDIFDNISTRNNEMQHYLALFELVTRIPTQSPRLAAIEQTAMKDDHGAIHQLARLRRLMRLAGLRHDPALSVLYFLLQATLLWDFHVLGLVERWQRRCRNLVRPWFDALGEFEALASLSGLAHDHPQWSYPQITAGEDSVLRARGIGHPLLRDDVRVANDVEVGPPGTVLLVTGSNMSGKSTLLRSIGLNALLAEAGGPVCCAELQLPSVCVTTSMRIQDSLEDGVSFFMAELKRLKEIVDEASRYEQRADRRLLYLLDEILQGTNSVERHLAVARVLAHLVGRGAIGAVSTHDLELAQSAELSDRCRAVHFRETLHNSESGKSMTFDYKLRSGVATTTNAMKLLELVGLVSAEDGSIGSAAGDSSDGQTANGSHCE